MNTPTLLTWSEKDAERSALWRSDQHLPARVVLADDTLTADAAYRLACEGTALLWRGDFQNARQMLQALGRRIDQSASTDKRGRRPRQTGFKDVRHSPEEAAAAAAKGFHVHRQAQAQRFLLDGGSVDREPEPLERFGHQPAERPAGLVRSDGQGRRQRPR